MKKIILLVFAIILTACSAAASTDFERNQSKWEDAKPAHYRYNLFIGCFCPFMEDMPLTIEVKNGEVISTTKADGTPVDATKSSVRDVSDLRND
jgi:hypothetical protein